MPPSPRTRRSRRARASALLLLAASFSACGAAAAAHPTSTAGSTPPDAPMPTSPARPVVHLTTRHIRHHSTSRPTTTTSQAPGPLAAPAPGLVSGRVTIFGDSVTIDAGPDLVADIPGASMQAAVGEQWYQGVAEAQSLKAEGQLGAVVVVALGTNGPLTSADVASMMQVLAGCSRVVFVTNHVPDYWQNPNNALLQQAARTYKNVVVADWESLAAANPQWFYADGTHMPIGGAGAQAYARLVASKI